MPFLPGQVPISEDRAWTLLQNYRLRGVVHYFATILRKCRWFLSPHLQKAFRNMSHSIASLR